MAFPTTLFFLFYIHLAFITVKNSNTFLSPGFFHYSNLTSDIII